MKTVSQENCDQAELASLLEIDASTDTLPQDKSVRSASTVDEPISVPETCRPQQAYCKKSFQAGLLCCAGYIAPKSVMKTNCKVCITLLTMPAQRGFHLARLTNFPEKGGLFPYSYLQGFVSQLEDMFTESFSCHELHSVSILDVLAILKERFSQEVGRAEHASGLSKDNQLLFRDMYPIKGINSRDQRSGKWQNI